MEFVDFYIARGLSGSVLTAALRDVSFAEVSTPSTQTEVMFTIYMSSRLTVICHFVFNIYEFKIAAILSDARAFTIM